MASCSICGEAIPAGSRTCSACGTSCDEVVALTTGLGAPARVAAPPELPAGSRYCPVCVRTYGPEYSDSFCSCGTELLEQVPAAGGDFPLAPDFDMPSVVSGEVPLAPFLDEEVPVAPVLDDVPTAAILEEPKAPAAKPPPGTPCLVLYGADRQPLQYFALGKDATLIGRLDAVAGNFPDVDLDEWFERSLTRRISRQHALILRSRATKTFSLRPLPGNTGTQLEGSMVAAGQEYPLTPGHRIVLGGVVRLKFEIA